MAEAAAVVEMGEEIKTAVAADVLRTLVTAGYIEEIAMQHALDTLAVAGFYVDIPPRLKPVGVCQFTNCRNEQHRLQ